MTELKQQILKFISKRYLLSIATVDEENNPWVCNVYFSQDEDLNIYFISPNDTNHSKHIKNNSKVAFTVNWYDENSLDNRKAIQAIGICKQIGIKDLKHAIKCMIMKYPDWKDFLTFEKVTKDLIKSKVYKITPSYIKYWDDELFGEEGVREMVIGKQ